MKNNKTSLLIIVDQYYWAWGIASRELLHNMPNMDGQIVDVKDFVETDINAETYDVVLVYPWYDEEVMKKVTPANTIICVAGGDVLEGDSLSTFKTIYSKFMVFGAANNTIKTQIEEMGKDPDKKVIILTHGVDTELFKPVFNFNSEFIVGWVGRCDRPLKRFKMAQEIVSELGIPLKIATQPHEGNYISHDKMPDFYNSINCLLITSEKEAHPLIVYEAMACGISVVATDVGDISKVITSRFDGTLLPTDAPISEFVEAIKKLMSMSYGSSSVAYEMGKNGRKNIIEKWSWDKIVPQYENLDEIVKETSKNYLMKNINRVMWDSLKFKENSDG